MLGMKGNCHRFMLQTSYLSLLNLCISSHSFHSPQERVPQFGTISLQIETQIRNPLQVLINPFGMNNQRTFLPSGIKSCFIINRQLSGESAPPMKSRFERRKCKGRRHLRQDPVLHSKRCASDRAGPRFKYSGGDDRVHQVV